MLRGGDGESFSNSEILDGSEYPFAQISYLESFDGVSITNTHDANLVPNAAGDAWVSRLQADYGNVAAASGYENILYDTKDLNSPQHAAIPAGSAIVYDMDFTVDIGTVRASQSGLVVTFDPEFEPVSARIGGMSATIDSQSAGTATLSFPDMVTALNWTKFGDQTLALTDSLGNEVSQTVEWLPADGYEHTDLAGASTSDQGSIFYNWGVAGADYADAVPPVAGDQIVYDTTYYSNISAAGIITIADGAPASFTSEAYLIDDDGMQAFNTDSGQGEPQIGEVPTIVLKGQSTVTVTQGDGYIDEGAVWTDAEDGTGTVYSSTVVNDQTPEGQYTLRYSYTDTDGNTASASRLVNVEAVQVTLPTVNQTTQPQTVTVGEQISVSATASDYDTFQWTADLDGTFEDETALTTTFTTAEHGQLTTTATAINADGSRSDSVTHTVEEPIAMGEFTATHNNVPDGPIETVVVNLDTSAVLFNGSKTWSDGKATFSFENLAAGDRLQVTTINESDGDAGLSVEYAA